MGSINNKLKAGAVYPLLLCYALFVSMLGQLIPFLRGEYGISMTEAGLFSTVQSFGSIVSVLICILFFDIFNKPKLLGWAALVFSIFAGAIGIGWVFALLLAVFCLVGFVIGMIDTLINAVISDLAKHEKGFHINLSHAFFGLGGVIGPVAAVLLSGTVGGRWAFTFLGILSLLCTVFYMAVFKDEMRQRFLPKETLLRQNIKNIFAFSKEKGMRYVLAASILVIFFETNVIFWAPSYFSQRSGDEGIGAVALTVFFATMTTGRFIGSKLAQKLKPYVFVSWCSLITFIFAFVSFVSSNLSISIAALAVSGLFYGNIFPQIIVQSCLIAPENSAMASGLVILGSMISIFFAPLLAGVIGDMAGLGIGLIVSAIFILPASLLGHQFKKRIP